jgi:hypothetical protein
MRNENDEQNSKIDKMKHITTLFIFAAFWGKTKRLRDLKT